MVIAANPSYPHGKAFRAGFTLVELLVATTLLSIVMTSVYTLTHASLRTWRSVEEGYDMHLEARSVMTLFSHEYNNIVGRAAHLFEGDSNEITMFVVAQPLDVERGEGGRLMRVIYSYNRNRRTLDREEALVETSLPAQPTGSDEIDRSRIKLARRHRSTVAENVMGFSIRYIWAPLPEEPEMGPDWDPELKLPPVTQPLIYQDRHMNRWGLPQGIEITLELRDPNNSDVRYPLTTVLPMRAPSERNSREALEEMFNASG